MSYPPGGQAPGPHRRRFRRVANRLSAGKLATVALSGPRYTLDIKNGLLYVPGGNPAPDFASGAREGDNLFTDSVVVLDAKTGDYKNHFKVVKKDWHDWDVSSPPILLQTMGGKQLMVGRAEGWAPLRLRSRHQQPALPRAGDHDRERRGTFAVGQNVHFCPGPVGGTEWNTPGFDPTTNLIITGTVDWCDTVTIEDADEDAVGGRRAALDRDGDAEPDQHVRQGRPDRRTLGRMDLRQRRRHRGLEMARSSPTIPIVAAITPTAGGIVFVGDLGGNFYALDSSTGQKLWGRSARDGGAIGGGVITYTVDGVQKVAVADGFTMVAWPTKPEARQGS